MDTLTHALSGALLARATSPARPRPGELAPGARTVAGLAAAAFPDVDFALRLVDTLTYLNWHQGPTHSLVLLPVWAWLLARLFAALARGRHHWKVFFVPAALGLGAHIAGDVITAYGTMLLWPLSMMRFELPLAFVFDPWISAVLALGLLAASRSARPGRAGLAVLLVLVSYAGLLAVLRQQALDAGAAYAARHPMHGARIHALPQPLSPFNRTIVVEAADHYMLARVSLYPGAQRDPPAPDSGLLARIGAAYRPLADVRWQRIDRVGGEVRAPAGASIDGIPGEGRGAAGHADAALAQVAWRSDAFEPFRRFAGLPALDRVERDAARVCVWFHDLRFSFPELPPSFRFGLCRDHPAQAWRLARERGAFWID